MWCHEVHIASVCSCRFSQFSCSNFLDCEQSKLIDILLQAKKTYEEAHMPIKISGDFRKALATGCEEIMWPWMMLDTVSLLQPETWIVGSTLQERCLWQETPTMNRMNLPNLHYNPSKPSTLHVFGRHKSWHVSPCVASSQFSPSFFAAFFAVIPGRIHGPRRDGARHDGCRRRHSGARALVALARPVTVTSAILGWENDGQRFFGWSYCCLTVLRGHGMDGTIEGLAKRWSLFPIGVYLMVRPIPNTFWPLGDQENLVRCS